MVGRPILVGTRVGDGEVQSGRNAKKRKISPRAGY